MGSTSKSKKDSDKNIHELENDANDFAGTKEEK